MMEARYVYPRLSRPVAQIIIEERADWSLERLRESSATADERAIPARVGNIVSETTLAAVRDAVRSELGQVTPAFPAIVPRGRRAEFDRIVGRALYENMAIVPSDAAAEGVWSFLTLVLLPEIGPRRFPGSGEKRLLGIDRNVLRRTWWRAHTLGVDLGGDSDGSSYLGEDELVNIFERPTLSANPVVAQRLVAAIHARGSKTPKPRSEFVRDLTRRLLRLTPFVSLDALGVSQLDDLLAALVETSAASLASREAQKVKPVKA